MTRSRQEIESVLTGGAAVGGIALPKPVQRRLLRFLLTSKERGTSNFSDTYIAALKSAFTTEEDEADAVDGTQLESNVTPRAWRLARIEAKNFGGVNTYGGPKFELDVGSECLCIQGYNGRGKTSLASTIVWALTGQRLCSQTEPNDAVNFNKPVRCTLNREARSGQWPPAVAYPISFASVGRDLPQATVKLTFVDEDGQVGSITRRTEGLGSKVKCEGGFVPPELLTEISVLMPNRIPHIRLSDDRRLVEALIQLIGLEPLRELGEHVRALCNQGRNFAGFPKSRDIDEARRAVTEALLAAANTKKGQPRLADLPALPADSASDLCARLETIETEISRRKTELFAAVSNEVPAGTDLSSATEQGRIEKAVWSLEKKFKGDAVQALPSVRILRTIQSSKESGRLDGLVPRIEHSERALVGARARHRRLEADSKLRLKAAAAQWHRKHHPAAESVQDCPLCDRPFDGEAMSKLGEEIQALKTEAVLLNRSYDDALQSLAIELTVSIPKDIGLDVLPLDGDFNSCFVREFREFLETDSELSQILPEAREFALSELAKRAKDLPRGLQMTAPTVERLVESEARLVTLIHQARVLDAVSVWWATAQPSFEALESALFGFADKQGRYPEHTLLSALETLLSVVQLARPFDELASYISRAGSSAKKLEELSKDRKLRDEIIAALEPLKGLPKLVEDEAATALLEVSTLAREIFDDIYYPGALRLEGAGIGRRRLLEVDGALNKDVLLDATLIANSSWIRAFLWAFLFALRQKTIDRIGHNPLPLLVLDDPQTTLDVTHERQWATLLAKMAIDGAPVVRAAQLFVTSYDKNFFRLMEKAGYEGRRATVNGIEPVTQRLSVLEGEEIDRRSKVFDADPREKNAQDYIACLREQLEGQLQLMLHAFAAVRVSRMMKDLLQEFESRAHCLPFSSPRVRNLVAALRADKMFLDTINAAHHGPDLEKLGSKDAIKARESWRKIGPLLDAAFHELREYEYFGPRAPVAPAYTAPAAVLPLKLTEVIQPLRFEVKGHVAAANDGRVAFAEVSGGSSLRFPNHAAVLLTADTIHPVAKPGDVLLIRQHHEARDGDLVIAAVGEKVYARRFKRHAEDVDQIVLIAVSADPIRAPPPIVCHRLAVVMKIIDGVIFGSGASTTAALTNEVEEMSTHMDLLALSGGRARVFQVSGDSASPVALNGQYLLVEDPVRDAKALQALDGQLVLASSDGRAGDEHYFKRLNWRPPLAVLESVARHERFPPVIVSLQDGGPWPKLQSAARVNGILFAPSPARLDGDLKA